MKLKVFFILNLFSMLGLLGCAKSQIGVQVIDLGNIDYELDVAYFYSNSKQFSEADDSTKIDLFYEVDSTKFYNVETDELYPSLVIYGWQGGENLKTASFGKFDLYQLSMATTSDHHLVAVKGATKLSRAEFSVLKKDLDKKYGSPIPSKKESFSEPNELSYRWGSDDEYVQLMAIEINGNETLAVDFAKGIQSTIKKGSDKSYLEVVICVWQKKYHDLVVVHQPIHCEMSWDERGPYHAKDAQYYTPETVKPFLITAHYLDSLNRAGDVWSKIVASYYHPIPNGKLTDLTGMTDSVKVNREGCLPYWNFGPLIPSFKGMSNNAQYIVQQMQKGTKFADMLNDRTVCLAHSFWEEAEWIDKKKKAGIVCLEQMPDQSMALKNFDIIDHLDIYYFALHLTDLLKEELQKSGLDLEKTTARYVSIPIGTAVVFFTDGKLELFTPLPLEEGSANITKSRTWESERVYPIIDLLKEY